MKKAAKITFISLCIILLFLALFAPIISSHMQGYYKGLIGTSIENTQTLLEKKQLWVTIGETKIFFILFFIILFSFLITELIMWIRRNKLLKK